MIERELEENLQLYICTLPFSAGLRDALDRHGILTVEDLLKHTEAELRQSREINTLAMNDIYRELAHLGFRRDRRNHGKR